MRHVLLILSFLHVVNALESDDQHSPFMFSRQFDPKGSVVLKWGFDYDTEEMTLELQVRTTGWIGFGLSINRNLERYDMVIGGIFPNNTAYFADRFMEGEWPPKVDEMQNYQLLSLSENDTSTTMRFRRKFRTCDPNDIDITNDTLSVISSYGFDDTLQFEEDCQFVKSIFLVEIVPPKVTPSTYFTYDVKLNDFPVPEEDTTYACTFIPMPAVTKKHHIYMYEPRIDPTTDKIVHHILVYACANDTMITSEVGDCYGGDPTFSQCNQVIFGWAVGGSPFFLPPDVGIPLGTPLDPYYIRLEIHFSNFEGKEGLIDNSGIRIYYTSELREHDGGIIQYGVFTFPIHFIPPGAESYKSYGLCHTEKFHEANGNHVEDMTVIAFLLHAHLTGRGVRIIHYRNGTLLGTLGEDNSYDFRLQESRHHRHTYTVKVGDVIVVECTQNTMDRDTVTFGGPSTLNEMCLGFLFYYPRTNISKCWGYTDVLYVTEELGLEPTTDVMEAIGVLYEVEWNDELIKKAEKAAKESVQTIVIESRQGIKLNETGFIPEIEPSFKGPCNDVTFNNLDQPMPDERVNPEPANAGHPQCSGNPQRDPDERSPRRP